MGGTLNLNHLLFLGHGALWTIGLSRVKRAATSATRCAPLVTTTYCTTTRIRKTTAPTM